jgi:hypothetical protein
MSIAFLLLGRIIYPIKKSKSAEDDFFVSTGTFVAPATFGKSCQGWDVAMPKFSKHAFIISRGRATNIFAHGHIPEISCRTKCLIVR